MGARRASESDAKPMKKWHLHIDHPWSHCVREYGAPMRLYLTTPWGFWEFGERSQVYDRKTGRYTTRWARLTYRPLVPAHEQRPVRSRDGHQ